MSDLVHEQLPGSGATVATLRALGLAASVASVWLCGAAPAWAEGDKAAADAAEAPSPASDSAAATPSEAPAPASDSAAATPSDKPAPSGAHSDPDRDNDDLPRVAPVTYEPPVPVRHATPHRLAISLGGGWGTAGGGPYIGDVGEAVLRANPGSTLGGGLESGSQLNALLGVRYYFPYHVMAQVEFGGIYNHGAADVSFGGGRLALENYSFVLEVPVLVGGYYALSDRVYLQGAAGPSFFFFSYSYWDPGDDFEASGGVGLHALIGADYLLAHHFGIGVELRYRAVEAGPLYLKGTPVELTSGALRGDGSSDSYTLDFSGVSVLMHLRVFAI